MHDSPAFSSAVCDIYAMWRQLGAKMPWHPSRWWDVPLWIFPFAGDWSCWISL